MNDDVYCNMRWWPSPSSSMSLGLSDLDNVAGPQSGRPPPSPLAAARGRHSHCGSVPSSALRDDDVELQPLDRQRIFTGYTLAATAPQQCQQQRRQQRRHQRRHQRQQPAHVGHEPENVRLFRNGNVTVSSQKMLHKNSVGHDSLVDCIVIVLNNNVPDPVRRPTPAPAGNERYVARLAELHLNDIPSDREQQQVDDDDISCCYGRRLCKCCFKCSIM